MATLTTTIFIDVASQHFARRRIRKGREQYIDPTRQTRDEKRPARAPATFVVHARDRDRLRQGSSTMGRRPPLDLS